MKKVGLVLILIGLLGLSSLTDFAISLSQEPRWNPFVQVWKRNLPGDTIKEITVCGSEKTRPIESLQR